MSLLFLSTYKDPSTPLTTEHIPQPLKIFVDFVLKVGSLLGGGCSLEAPPHSLFGAPLFYSHALSGKSTLYSPVVTIYTTSLTFNNSTFCPQCVYVFCVDLRTNSDYFTVHH
jgi:hypothetical protein